MSEQTFPDPFLTNVLNAELVAQNKLGYLLINLDKTIIPLKLDKDYFIDDDYLLVTPTIETTIKYGPEYPAWPFLVKREDIENFAELLDGNKINL